MLIVFFLLVICSRCCIIASSFEIRSNLEHIDKSQILRFIVVKMYMIDIQYHINF